MTFLIIEKEFVWIALHHKKSRNTICSTSYRKIQVKSLGLSGTSSGVLDELIYGVGEGAYERNFTKKVSKQADNKTYLVSLQDQIRNSNFNYNRNITKQDQTLFLDSN